jgi:hypothetical protein
MTGILRRRVLAPIGLAVAGLFLLTGCLTYVEREEIPPYSLIMSTNFSERPWDWAYIDSDGEERELPCEDRVCDSADGTVHMRYSAYKGRFSVREMVVDGKDVEMERVRFEDMEGIRRVWVTQEYYDSLPK